MKKLFFTIFTMLALLLGTAALSETRAQVYMYYDPFEVPESSLDEELQSEGMVEDTLQFSSETTTLIVCTAVVLWAVLVVFLLRLNRIKKNKVKRINMEAWRYWNMRRAATFVWLSLFFVIPAKAQIFLDEETREYTMRVNAAPPDAKPIKPITTREYVPLGGEVLVLGLLGGAYLLGKKREE